MPEVRIRDQLFQRPDVVLELQVIDVAKGFGKNRNFKNVRTKNLRDDVPLLRVRERLEAELSLELSQCSVN